MLGYLSWLAHNWCEVHTSNIGGTSVDILVYISHYNVVTEKGSSF